jgi:Aspartyl protease
MVATPPTAQCKEFEEVIELDRLDQDLRSGEFDALLTQCTQIAQYCSELEHQLRASPSAQRDSIDPDNQREAQSLISQLLAVPPDAGNLHTQSNASISGELNRIEIDDVIEPVPELAERYQGSPNLGIQYPPNKESTFSAPPVELGNQQPGTGASEHVSALINQEATVLIAAARIDDPNKDREFRSAQRRDFTTGERPCTSKDDRQCMAALVKVNGLEAYALLDSGSTTISVTHDFSRVAKLNMFQLDNPVKLQLGTVGSQSVINFGSRASLELGSIKDKNAYLDVVNIDRYDMIIGTPFMRKHGLVLDFDNDMLTHKGRPIPTLAAGQEDLMIAQRRSTQAWTPAPGGTISQSDH